MLPLLHKPCMQTRMSHWEIAGCGWDGFKMVTIIINLDWITF